MKRFIDNFTKLFSSKTEAQIVIPDFPIKDVEKCIQYTFKNPSLLAEALTHSSYSLGHTIYEDHYERLEFLGDAVLQLVATDFIFEQHPHLNEGTLTKYRTILVNGNFLTSCSTDLGLHNFLRASNAILSRNDREQESIRADIVESVIGAIYIDGSYEDAKNFIHHFILKLKPNYSEDLQTFNYKGQLAEKCQRLGLGTPIYLVSEESGPDHSRIFIMQTQIQDKIIGFGEGFSKKEASQNAANDALKNWNLSFDEF
jgi:ribonuclease III